jgi:hypothetical protein
MRGWGKIILNGQGTPARAHLGILHKSSRQDYVALDWDGLRENEDGIKKSFDLLLDDWVLVIDHALEAAKNDLEDSVNCISDHPRHVTYSVALEIHAHVEIKLLKVKL